MKHWELEHNDNYMRIEWNEAATFNFQMPIGGQWVDYPSGSGLRGRGRGRGRGIIYHGPLSYPHHTTHTHTSKEQKENRTKREQNKSRTERKENGVF